LLLIWQLVVFVTGAPHYILPGPVPVFHALVNHRVTLLGHLQTTLTEILLGILLGSFLGVTTALIMTLSPLLKRWMLPVLVISQAIPVFALAPILVLGSAMAWRRRWPWRCSLSISR
jgi:putative hydroxymethylpyrimidine transport system permease protein